MSGERSGSVAGAGHTTDGRRRGRLYRVEGGFHDPVVRLAAPAYPGKGESVLGILGRLVLVGPGFRFGHGEIFLDIG